MPNSCPVCGKNIDTCGCGRKGKIRVDFSHLGPPAPKVRVPSPEGFWRTKDGKFKAIAEMDNSYLDNCIRMLQGRTDSGSRNKLNELRFEKARRENLTEMHVDQSEIESIGAAYQRYLRAAQLERERVERERRQREQERENERQRAARERDRIYQSRQRSRYGLPYVYNSPIQSNGPATPTMREIEEAARARQNTNPAPEPPKPAEPEISVDPNKPERIIRRRRNG